MNPMIAQLFWFLFFIVSGCASLDGQKTQHFSIMQGLTSERNVEFNVVTSKHFSGSFKVKNQKGEYFGPSQVKKMPFPLSDEVIHQITFELNPELDQDLFLEVYQEHILMDQRTFRLFNNRLETMKFVVASCLNGLHEDRDVMWKAVQEAKPEIIFLLGDNLYYSKNLISPKDMSNELLRFRQTHPMFFSPRLIPTHAVWDDNDYGMNNGDETYEFKKEAKEYFTLIYPQSLDQTFIDRGPGVSSRLHLRGMHFVFLDNRTFRSADKEGSHFGSEQEEWFFKGIETSGLPTWIISGDQFFGGYHSFDSYEGKHPTSFKKFIERLSKTPTPFVFVSGDRHMSEIMQFPSSLVGQLSFEFTSSPLHSKVYPDNIENFSNPWRVTGVDDQSNFMLMETSLQDKSWDMSVSFLGRDLKPILHRDLSIYTERLKEMTMDKKIPRRRYRRIKNRGPR
jgi:hypothetical protein